MILIRCIIYKITVFSDNQGEPIVVRDGIWPKFELIQAFSVVKNMRGSNKFCQRGPTLTTFFLVDGIEKWAITSLPAQLH